VTVVDACQTDDEDDSRITININNFKYTGEYIDEEENSVRCKNLIAVEQNDNSKAWRILFFEETECFVY